MNDETLRLGNQLCFPLYTAAREVVRAYRPLLEEIDLTYTQYIVMMVLWEKRETTIGAVGKALLLDSGTLTPVVKSLAAKGYLDRRRDGRDERVLTLSLTEKGEALREKALSIPEKMSCRVLLSPEEAKTLRALLDKVIENCKL